jgi:hypothetical protein
MKPRRAPSIGFVYVLRNRDGAPLYVGMSRDVTARLKQHSVAPYGDQIADVTVEIVPGLPAAAARELELIAELDPPFNTSGRPEAQDNGSRKCHYFRFCGREAVVVREERLPRGVRRVGVCEEHRLRTYERVAS